MLVVNQLAGGRRIALVYATLDAARTSGTPPALSNGNLRATGPASSFGRVAGTLVITSKTYFEFKKIDATFIGNQFAAGVQDSSQALATGQFSGSPTSSGCGANEWMLTDRGSACNNVTYTASVTSSFSQNDVGMCAVDPPGGKIWFGRNGTFNGDPVAGTGAAFTNVPASVYALAYGGISTQILDMNFGEVAFAHTAPSGYGVSAV
jgi:hypothetical protein